MSNKNATIEKLKNGSRIIGALCGAVAVFNLVITVVSCATVFSQKGMAAPSQYGLFQNAFTFLISAVIMGIAAVLFFRIAKDGIPFTGRNVRMVRLIAVLLMMNAIVPTTLACLISGTMPGIGAFISPNSLIEGLLFLFIARTIRYGAMLQQESDETL
jgi:ABC-type amino acid transport system permease subunit